MINKTSYQNLPGYRATTKKIEEFRTFEEGWDFGDGVSFEDSILGKAIELNDEAFRVGFSETDVFPGSNGEIMVTVYDNTHYLEFSIESEDRINFSCEEGDEEVDYQEGLSFLEAKAKIEEFYRQWNGYESLTKNDMIVKSVDSSLMHLSQTKSQKYPSLILGASSKLTRPSVGTSFGITIQRLQTILQPSGYSQQKYYRPATS